MKFGRTIHVLRWLPERRRVLALWTCMALTIAAVTEWTALGEVSIDPQHSDDRTLVPESMPALELVQSHRVMGAGSCSSTSCHGSISPFPASISPVYRNEHTTWMSDDPHSRAYQVLFNARSESISRSLARDGEPPIPAHEDARCLACHATPQRADDLRTHSVLNEDGVGCESCHGPAERWLGEHTSAAWRRLDDPAKERLGFVPLNNLPRRIEQCAGCHVGQRRDPTDLADRDVNHDLIAAGHPRLNFEYAAYADNLPRHWAENRDKDSIDLAARAWAIGQWVVARESVELLRDRALEGSAPWPELAEYGCFSCHHQLTDSPWRRTRSRAGVTPGQPEWGSWPIAMARSTELDGLWNVEDWTRRLDPLASSMSRLTSDRARVVERAGRLLPQFDEQVKALAAHPISSDQIRKALATLNSQAGWRDVSNWDAAAQRYLAMAALGQTAGQMSPSGMPEHFQDRLEELRRLLEFPTGYDSPRDFEPGSPAN